MPLSGSVSSNDGTSGSPKAVEELALGTGVAAAVGQAECGVPAVDEIVEHAPADSVVRHFDAERPAAREPMGQRQVWCASSPRRASTPRCLAPRIDSDWQPPPSRRTGYRSARCPRPATRTRLRADSDCARVTAPPIAQPRGPTKARDQTTDRPDDHQLIPCEESSVATVVRAAWLSHAQMSAQRRAPAL